MKKLGIISTLAASFLFSSVTHATNLPFSDVTDHWASVSIQWAIEADVVKGYSDGTFKPNSFVTEAEFLTMLFRALPTPNREELKETKHWSDHVYHWASTLDYPITGQTNLTIRNQPINRKQVAEIIAAANGDPFIGDAAILYCMDRKLANGKIKHENPLEAYKGNDLLTRAEAVQFLLNALQNGLKETQSASDRGETTTKRWTTPPDMIIDPKKDYRATIVTNKGQLTIELFAKDAPKTVNNFVFLSKEGYYQNVLFHRVIQDFMVQTGDPTGTGRGNPGYRFQDELKSPAAHQYELGVVAMANAGPNTNGSQFFICNGTGSESLNLYPMYTIFGRVVDGWETLDSISNVEVKLNATGDEKSVPVEDVFIHNILIHEKL
ncbi:peptidylprolyl isomerase [Ammoniphilus sp. CFH 90114]|uniref:peptidylprolyl isomerase n=1 Tax=Ammoniphilus sp. CFH 90114 TaxID=2493665 RepID=UPI00100FF05A|nr:peptidylprolyl isomerase [Ammoniphilus sp. CFH 90114]RXT06361.1 hypothetical protein EIZ39_14900 [Ammoniphilus sp. CFH 90114]